MMTSIRPTLKEIYEKARKSSDTVEEAADRAENEMRNRIQQIHEELDQILDENLTKLKQMKEESLVPVRHDMQKIDEKQASLEASIKEYERNLRSDDPIDLISFMKEHQSDDPGVMFPVPVIQEVATPEFITSDIASSETASKFGQLTLKQHGSKEKMKDDSEERDIDLDGAKKKLNKPDGGGERRLGASTLTLMSNAVLQSEFSIADKLSKTICGLRCQGSVRVWIAGYDDKMYLVDRSGNVIKTINACSVYRYTGLYVTGEYELIFSDRVNKKLKKISHDFSVTTLFSTGDKACGLYQQRSGNLVVCLSSEKVIRVYNRAGKVITDIGKGCLQDPNYVTANKVNDDVCVSDYYKQVVIFSSSGEKRFTYTGDSTDYYKQVVLFSSSGEKRYKGDSTGFDPYDLCCDQLGNILITDLGNHRVHIIDRDGHFLQYVVSGRENISYPVTIDIDSNGYVVIGERDSRKVKIFVYLQ